MKKFASFMMIKSKYKAKPTTIDGIRFSSIRESKAYMVIRDMQKKGEILYFLRQVPFTLPGGVKYVTDFMLVYPDNRIEYIDVKGFSTKEFIMKKKMVESLYPIEIKIWK